MAPGILALTMGDPAGIGLDLTVALWAQRQSRACPAFLLLGDETALRQRADDLGLRLALQVVEDTSEALAVFEQRLPLISVSLANPVSAGQPDGANAAATISSIEQATALVAAGHAAALVTNPIAKATLYDAGFKHPGHTEFLGELAGRHNPGNSYKPVMMLSGDELRVVPLTVHIPLRDVPAAITAPLIRQTAHITHAALARDFGIARPRIAFAGLNPHAGEAGSIGREDIEIIAPAIDALRREGMDVSGPHPGDTLFHKAARARYDAVIAMYHDQALIPLKTLAFETGVNVTLGLPFIRTSPDHGTAFDLAGSGRASPESLLAALKMAAMLGERRSKLTAREADK